MAQDSEQAAVELPKVHLVHMIVFMIAVLILAAVLFPNIQRAFMANAGLNGLIIGILLLGVLYAFRMVWRLWPEIKWVNSFRINDPLAETEAEPVLLAPMASLLAGKEGTAVLSPLSMRALLDSLAARLDEARDISRYLVSLLIFLGLLGTFWGLLETVSSVGDAIRALDVTSTQSGTLFEELKSGLERPLAGMGLSFAASLFGLAGSLILGFLDLKAAQAQNRFYNDFENWLSTITDIEAADASGLSSPNILRHDLQAIERGIKQVNQSLNEAVTINRTRATEGNAKETESLDQLADAVASLVQQMREEQKVVRQWVQSQQVQQNEMQRQLNRLGGQPQRGAAKRYSFETEE
jgi:membrane associated rhomboid family serine protease